MIAPNLFLVIFNVGLNLILIPRYSYIGAAAATVLTEILVVFLYWRLMHRFADLKIHWQILPKVLFSAIILGLVLFLAKNLSLWILLPLAIIVYFTALWLVKGISKEMILTIVKKSKEQ